MKSHKSVPDHLNQSVARACALLRSFHSETEVLRLCDLAGRTGLDSATVLRLLRTLESHGLVERSADRHYRSRVRLLERARYTLGYAAQSSEFAFSREVTSSIIKAAEDAGIQLVMVNNRYSRASALRNADALIRRRVDLVLEFQTDERIAPIVASKYMAAGIPLIAIEIPHPGAVFFGSDNYHAGLMGGQYLGRWAAAHWGGQVDEILLLELHMAGPLPASRLTGILRGIRMELPALENLRPVVIDVNGQYSRSLEKVRKHIARRRAGHTLVGAINDPSALGAVRAFEEAGRAQECAVMGQNASAEARAEMRRPGTRLVGSVAYFPERYGERLIELAIKILEKKQVPPAVFVRHQTITPASVDHYYPNEAVLSPGDLDALML